ncbi:MAG: sigma-70 family RNA polymerase sigma factor [Planctomycetes bacterium]|nr:sigma-70 family RNA polymerase sigma factor [Planctomycetota bacterium]
MEAAAKATKSDEPGLIRRMQAGEMAAFAELVRRYQDRVYNTVWRICSHTEDARDLTQEAFLKAQQSIGSFRGHSGFYTWVFRIAVNLAISHRRKAARRRTLSLDAPPAAGDSDRAASGLAARMQEKVPSSPDAEAMKSEIHGHVAAALEGLDEEFRTVVVLRDIEGLDYRQISEVLGIATGTVKSRLHRARVALREALGPVLRQEV